MNSIKVTLPLPKLTPPTLAESFIIAARQLHSGAEVLFQNAFDCVLAYSVLSAQVLECALKAYLAQHGYEEKELIKIGHNLKKLWDMAEKKSLGISSKPPDWCIALNEGHDYPYHFRYPVGLNVIGYPNLKEVKKGLSEVMKIVEASVKKPYQNQ